MDADWGCSRALILAFVLLWLLPLVPLVFYLLTLHRTLAACAPANRRMEPGAGVAAAHPASSALVWQFFVVLAVSGSLGAGVPRSAASPPSRTRAVVGPGHVRPVGLRRHPVPRPAGRCSASLVCWILYWVKIAGFRNLLVPVA